MRKILFTLLCGVAFMAVPVSAVFGQGKLTKCQDAAKVERNWEQVGQIYIYFDYTLCPSDLTPPHPLVRVWITSEGNGYAVEKWASDRDGADIVTVFSGKKKAFTLFRDLNAVPLRLLKSDRRSTVPAETRDRPFLLQGTTLIPSENFTPDSAEKTMKVFTNADELIRTAESKSQLLHESDRMGIIIGFLSNPPQLEN